MKKREEGQKGKDKRDLKEEKYDNKEKKITRRGTGKRTVTETHLSVEDVHARPRVPELLRQSKVDQEELVAVAADAHQEIVRLDVAVDERLAVHELYAADHLVRQHQHRLDREAPRAEVEKVLQRRAEQVHDQHVVVALLSIVPADNRDGD